MGLDFYKIAAALGKEAIPLVQNMIGSYVDGKVMEKSSQLFDKKMDQSMMILNKHDPEAPGARKSPDKKIGLSTGILQNETKEELGRRKWKEYENHIEALPPRKWPSASAHDSGASYLPTRPPENRPPSCRQDRSCPSADGLRASGS